MGQRARQLARSAFNLRGEHQHRAPSLRRGAFLAQSFVQLGEAKQRGQEALVDRERLFERRLSAFGIVELPVRRGQGLGHRTHHMP